MTAKQYISFFYGDKEKAILHLERAITLYESSACKQTPKTIKRKQEYKDLLIEIKTNNGTQ
jgi:hypothetical protein